LDLVDRPRRAAPPGNGSVRQAAAHHGSARLGDRGDHFGLSRAKPRRGRLPTTQRCRPPGRAAPVSLDGPKNPGAYVHLSVSAPALSPRGAGVSGRRLPGQPLELAGPPQYDPLSPGALAGGHPQRASTLYLALGRLCARSLAALSPPGPPSAAVCVYV